MGLALLLLVLKLSISGARTSNIILPHASGPRFRAHLRHGRGNRHPYGFQFGTNWARFSAYAGDIIAQTLAMEGAFAFFLESAFLGIFSLANIFFGQKMHWFRLLWSGWEHGLLVHSSSAQIPGCSIRSAMLWHPAEANYTYKTTGQYSSIPGSFSVSSHHEWRSHHGCFFMTGLGAFYLLSKRDEDFGRIFVPLVLLLACLPGLSSSIPVATLKASRSPRTSPPS